MDCSTKGDVRDDDGGVDIFINDGESVVLSDRPTNGELGDVMFVVAFIFGAGDLDDEGEGICDDKGNNFCFD